MSDESDLAPSKLGTKQHWDDVYSSELNNFEEIGDEGEIWFGEDSMEKMVDWVQDNISKDPAPTILEVGAGNGALLFALQEAGYQGSRIQGVDYSEGAVKLARAIGATKGEGCEDIVFNACDFLRDYPPPLDGPVSKGVTQWDLVLDKGTFDAIALADKDEYGNAPADGYPSRIGRVVKSGGYFLIVSCNFTEEELKVKFAFEATGLQYHSHIRFPSISFGGKSGNVYSSVAFRKPS